MALTTERQRRSYSSGTQWEPIVGYCRAVRVGDQVVVSGTTATLPDGSIAGIGDARAQTLRALANIREALEALGARLEDVVRTRLYVTDVSAWEAVGRAHGEVFGSIRPACTLVEVSALVHPDLLVEIEADAIVVND
jgi:enamine deaminase RidA (YjgF/YER057c/UK114 family)